MHTRLLSFLCLFTLVLTLQADNSIKRLKVAGESLDKTLTIKDQARCTSEICAALKIEQADLRKALDAKFKLSTLALVQLLAEKSEQPFAKVLPADPGADMLVLLQAVNLTAADAIEHLDMVQTELAFAVLDRR